MTPLPFAVVTGVAAAVSPVGVAAGIGLRAAIGRVHGARAPRRPAVEAATALAFALVAGAVAHAVGRAPSGWSTSPVAAVLVGAAFLWLAAASVALAVVDVETRRLPDALVLPGYATGTVLLGGAAAVSGDALAAVRAGVGLVALGGFYLVLRLIRPDGMGGGDVKLAGVLGLHLGFAGWAPLAVGAMLAFLLGGVVSAAVMATRRGGRHATIAFGPWMLTGAWLGLAWAAPLVALYTGSLSGA